MAGFSGSGAFGGATSGAMIGTMIAPGVGTVIGGALGALGGGMFGGGPDIPNIDISAEMSRIDALYNQAREQGSAVITRDFQAQRGELAQSQAARGILRSGVSQLGLARLGAGREQALGAFNSQLYSAQAGQQSALLNALMGRKSAIDMQNAQNNRIGFNQVLGAASGLVGAYKASGGFAPKQGGTNFAGTNMVSPSSNTPQGFYQRDFGGGYGADNLTGGQMLGSFNGPQPMVAPYNPALSAYGGF